MALPGFFELPSLFLADGLRNAHQGTIAGFQCDFSKESRPVAVLLAKGFVRGQWCP
ncbi:MAG: hypothetical protein ACD_10C00453G0002 [uncultured bacterium]|nr:MAG: hypothetical protein ACD_10C00453G0002 [uncultured bacterium]